MTEMIKIGIDTGGTFTDFLIYHDNELIVRKVPSTPSDPSLAILSGIEDLISCEAKLFIIHGSTVATNTLLEGKGAKIALITTEGFEDLIFIGRQNRKNLYSLTGEDRRTLLPGKLCFGAKERTTARGEVEKTVDSEQIMKIADLLSKSKVEAVVISLINSYANFANEESIAKILEERKYLVSVSSRLLPEHREYERTVATAVNGYLMPVINRYISNLDRNLPESELKIMQSNEGYISSGKAIKEPIRTALSGPAGGVVGAFNIARSAGYKKIISFDMGGTSTDVSLVDGVINRTTETVIGDFPLRLPIIDINTVGAGGGSIAFVDRGGALRVGPQSAGADPGPACYGKKGSLPTVTDANLLLGRLDPDFFLGGEMKIYPDRSKKSIERISKKIGKAMEETAEGILEIANANMEKAIRVISIERGIDPREFFLFSFGGAGGLHAVRLAERLNMKGVIIPKNAGVLSAFGLLLADSIKDYSRSLIKTIDDTSEKELENHFGQMEKIAVQEMKSDGFSKENILMERFIDLRYLGQSFEITVPYSSGEMGASTEEFRTKHEQLYSYSHPNRPVEIVNLRIKATGISEKIEIKRYPRSSSDVKDSIMKYQPLYYRQKYHKAAVYNRKKIEVEQSIEGPAIIVDYESTTFLPPEYKANVDPYLNIIITRGIQNE